MDFANTSPLQPLKRETFIGDAKDLKAPFVRLPRVENWPVILRQTLSRHLSDVFEWGHSDCGFWADVVQGLTGWDPIGDGRGYDDALSARRALKNAGYASLLELVEDRLVEIPVSEAMRGDLVYPMDDLGPMMSPFVLDGSHAFSKCMAGKLVISREQCVRAFAY